MLRFFKFISSKQKETQLKPPTKWKLRRKKFFWDPVGFGSMILAAVCISIFFAGPKVLIREWWAGRKKY